ncbi:MAG: DUF429 domain-containing protein [Halobacteriaceae archaeon]
MFQPWTADGINARDDDRSTKVAGVRYLAVAGCPVAWLPPRRVVGVDFSGAADAGEKIWLADGRVTDEALRVERCEPAAERFDCSGDREPTLSALREFLGNAERTAIGIDASFGLPATIVTQLFQAETWRESLDIVASRFDGPEALSEACMTWARETSERTFLKRATDEITGASSPYHWLVRHQTYYALVGLLEPLVAGGNVAVVPQRMVPDDPALPRLLEVYPATTLGRLGLHRERYKEEATAARERRRENLEGLKAAGLVIPPGLEDALVMEAGGHALDAVVAAYAVHGAIRDPDAVTPGRLDESTRLEGHIFA